MTTTAATSSYIHEDHLPYTKPRFFYTQRYILTTDPWPAVQVSTDPWPASRTSEAWGRPIGLAWGEISPYL